MSNAIFIRAVAVPIEIAGRKYVATVQIEIPENWIRERVLLDPVCLDTKDYGTLRASVTACPGKALVTT